MKMNHVKMQSILPNLIVAGVNKAGTTSIFEYLSRHPKVCISSVKETCYFLPLRYQGERMDDIYRYESLFAHCTGDKQVVMEATPGYFYGGAKLAKGIQDTLPDVKIILLLRDPATRLVSFFTFMKSMLLLDPEMSLANYIEQCKLLSEHELRQRKNNPYFGLEGGFYSKYIYDWFEIFGDNIKIIFFEDMKDNPHMVMEDLCQWLGIDGDFFEDFNFSIANQTVQYKNRWLHGMAIAVNQNLETFFRQHPQAKKLIREVYAMLNLKAGKKNVNQVNWDVLHAIFQESNQELAVFLSERGRTNLPDWLKN